MENKERYSYAARPEYQREYQRRWRQKNREEAIQQFGGCCEVCSSTLFLEFHHLDPEKKVARMARIWSWSKARRLAELAKCMLLCDTHHKRWHELYRKLRDGQPVDLKELARYRLPTPVQLLPLSN